MLPSLFAYVLFFFLDAFRAHKNFVFFCLLSTKKALNYPNNLIYITTYIKASISIASGKTSFLIILYV